MTNPNDVTGLVNAAMAAAKVGDNAEVSRLWNEVLRQDSDHPMALFYLGRQALAAQDPNTAIMLLKRAAARNPAEPVIQLNIAYAAAAIGDIATESQALETALKIDPYFHPALLNKGVLLERRGKKREAAQIYRSALKITPPEEQLPPSIRAHAIRAKQAVMEDSVAMKFFLDRELDAVRKEGAGYELARFDEAAAILTGLQKPFVHEPVGLHYPGLPATCFFPRSAFPWIGALEDMTDIICGELNEIADKPEPGFSPYVGHGEGVPLNQWAELNHSERWSALFLWKDGVRNERVCNQAPKTAAFLAELGMMDVPGFAPAAFFSALDPHTRIPPHTGVTNIRSIVHLPLIVPPYTGFRVGNYTQEFHKGRAWVFDDSIEHEAWNDSGQRRIILIFDIWNPNLSAAERGMLRELMAAGTRYRD
jgi:tetratricopeptide (TPR) repeat protein